GVLPLDDGPANLACYRDSIAEKVGTPHGRSKVARRPLAVSRDGAAIGSVCDGRRGAGRGSRLSGGSLDHLRHRVQRRHGQERPTEPTSQGDGGLLRLRTSVEKAERGGPAPGQQG